jgi:hypothetical protein
MSNSSDLLHPESTQLTSDPAAQLEYENWLSFHRVWGTISDAAIGAIAHQKRLIELLIDVSNAPSQSEVELREGKRI